MSFYLKDPGSRVDYAMDWRGYLDGQIIAASAWSVSPDDEGGIAIEAESFDLEQAAVTLSGGVAGQVYAVVNRVTLSDGAIDERALTIRVEER